MPRRINNVSELSTKALTCRRSAYRHSWVESHIYGEAEDARGDVFLYTEVMVCSRCGVEKHCFLDRGHGWRYAEKPKYKYPDDYLSQKGVSFDYEDIMDEYMGRRVTSPPTRADAPHKAQQAPGKKS